jgi:hypothetical protein
MSVCWNRDSRCDWPLLAVTGLDDESLGGRPTISCVSRAWYEPKSLTNLSFAHGDPLVRRAPCIFSAVSIQQVGLARPHPNVPLRLAESRRGAIQPYASARPVGRLSTQSGRTQLSVAYPSAQAPNQRCPADATAYRREMMKLPTATPRSQPRPVPLNASDTSPLVTTCAVADCTAPA